MASASNPPTGHAAHRKPLSDHSPFGGSQPALPLSAASEPPGLSRVDTSSPIERPATASQRSHSRPPSRGPPSRGDALAGAMGKLQKAPPQQAAPPMPPRIHTPPGSQQFSLSESRSPVRLRKPPVRRSSSAHDTTVKHNRSQSGLMPQPPPAAEARGRSSSAHPPGTRGPPPENRRVSAAAAEGAPRPESSNGSLGSQSPPPDTGERRGRLRRSFLPGNSSRSNSVDLKRGKPTSAAWILGQNIDYNTSFLANGEKVPELWNEGGDIFVYLDPKASGGGPSFRVPSFVIDYSLVFADLIDAEMMTTPTSSQRVSGQDGLSAIDAEQQLCTPPDSPPLLSRPAETRLYLPVSMSTPGNRSSADMERLISIRNMFAFLTGQPLVASQSQSTLFTVFLNIAAHLKEFEFTNADGSTYGDAVEMSFSFFMEQMGLCDVRHSREKTLESLILGERMHSMELYNEAFAHAVGKYAAMRKLKSPLWEQVSPTTRQRLERAHFDLAERQKTVNNRLESFEFPALFSGTANSTSMTEYKDVKYATWRKSYARMRQFVLAYYKSNFGNWPPKARSKKNPFTESGLNRQVLKILYSDLCALYDLIVDRESLTTRVIDQNAADIADDVQNPHTSAMRRVLGEFDQSSPPVLPPIPFDLPKLPSMAAIKENYHELSPKEQSKLDKNLQDYQMRLIINKAYDFETYKLKIPFLHAFQDFELKEAKGKTAAEMADQRLGFWLLLYVVIQSLPMLVVDAPGLKFTQGVEYFLCQPPKGTPPWMEGAPAVRKRWYQIPGGAGMVELSADAVEFGIEGVYHRSHCWLAAKRWELGEDAGPPLTAHEPLSPLQAPASVFADLEHPGLTASPPLTGRSESPPMVPPGVALRTRTGSPGDRRQSMYRGSVAFGLEPVPMLPDPASSRPASRVFSSRGMSPARNSTALMGRSRSSGNLQGMAQAQAQNPEPRKGSHQDSVGGSTFDDILKDMEKKPKKKKGIF